MPRSKDAGTPLFPVALAAVAIVWCAALPLLAGAFAGPALAALGVGGGMLAGITAVVASATFVRARRRRSCARSDDTHV